MTNCKLRNQELDILLLHLMEGTFSNKLEKTTPIFLPGSSLFDLRELSKIKVSKFVQCAYFFWFSCSKIMSHRWRGWFFIFLVLKDRFFYRTNPCNNCSIPSTLNLLSDKFNLWMLGSGYCSKVLSDVSSNSLQLKSIDGFRVANFAFPEIA